MSCVDGSEIYFYSMKIFQEDSAHHPQIYANWKCEERQVWVYFSEWKEEFKCPEFLLWVINHEFLHGIIDGILDDDDLWKKPPDGLWQEFPFFCGIDEVYGFSSFDTHFLPIIQERGGYVITGISGDQIIFGINFANKIEKCLRFPIPFK
jgi:hypothetical protein